MALTATIESGASLSDEVRVPAGMYVSQIAMPAAWTTAGLAFQVSADGGATYGTFADASGEVTYAVVANDTVIIDYPTHLLAGCVKIRSGTSGSPVNQLADRSLSLTCNAIGDRQVTVVDNVYFGSPATEGSWRIIRSSNDLLVQRLESGTWTTIHTFSAT